MQRAPVIACRIPTKYLAIQYVLMLQRSTRKNTESLLHFYSVLHLVVAFSRANVSKGDHRRMTVLLPSERKKALSQGLITLRWQSRSTTGRALSKLLHGVVAKSSRQCSSVRLVRTQIAHPPSTNTVTRCRASAPRQSRSMSGRQRYWRSPLVLIIRLWQPFSTTGRICWRSR